MHEKSAAINQTLFKEVNERMNESGGAVWAGFEDFVCECAYTDCFEHVRLSVREYESIRAHPRRFFVAPSDNHFVPHAEVLIHKDDRYWIVEKRGEEGRIAEQLDQRSRAAVG